MLTSTMNNTIDDYALDFTPHRGFFNELDCEAEPYGKADFEQIAACAISAFKRKDHWVPLYNRQQQATNKLDSILEAKSTAAMMELYKFRLLLDNFYLNSEDLIYDYILPIVKRHIVICKTFDLSSSRQLSKTLNRVSSVYNSSYCTENGQFDA